MARLLGRVRLSHLTDETTSPERQRQAIEKYADLHGHEVTGWAEDIDLSGSVSPFDAPELGPWLTPERLNEWDVLCAYRLDRIARRVIPLNELFQLCMDHDKILVSVSESIDLSNWVGRLVANVIAGVAEGELAAIRARAEDTFSHNITTGKYRGGTPPWGYKPERVDGEWRLVVWDKMRDLLLETISLVLEGKKPNTICRDYNDRGELTPSDHFRVLQGEEPKGFLWRPNNMRRDLRSPAMLGQVVRSYYKTVKGKKVYGEPQILRGEDGAPIVRATPLVDRELFDRLQEALKTEGNYRAPNNNSKAILVRVIHCGSCGSPMYRSKGRSYWYYRCSGQEVKRECTNRGVRTEEADRLVKDTLLSLVGELERMEKVYVPGEDTATELADVDAELADVAGLIGTGPFKSGPARERLEARAEALGKRRDELAAKPTRAAGYDYRPTGQTFRQHWETLGIQGRNLFLREHGVRLDYTRDGNPEFDLTFGDLPSLVGAIDHEAGKVVKERMGALPCHDA